MHEESSCRQLGRALLLRPSVLVLTEALVCAIFGQKFCRTPRDFDRI